MKVILLKNIEKVGKEGQSLEVKDGYGRNYLVPQGLALPATEANLKKAADIKKKSEKRQEKEKKNFSQIKEKIENLSLTVTAQAKEDEVLYGAITVVQIKKLLEEEGIQLEKEKIKLNEPIKKLGVYKIPLQLSEEDESTLRLWVVKK